LSKKKRLIIEISFIALLLIASLAVYLIMELSRAPGDYVSVSVGEEVVMEIPLTESGEYPILGGKNILVIENGYAYMKYADCPKQVCVNTGMVAMSGEKIICSHNGVKVRVITGDGEDILESR
jgi:hypothetical protein